MRARPHRRGLPGGNANAHPRGGGPARWRWQQVLPPPGDSTTVPPVKPRCESAEDPGSGRCCRRRLSPVRERARRASVCAGPVPWRAPPEDSRAHSSIGQSPRLIPGWFLVRIQVGLRSVSNCRVSNCSVASRRVADRGASGRGASGRWDSRPHSSSRRPSPRSSGARYVSGVSASQRGGPRRRVLACPPPVGLARRRSTRRPAWPARRSPLAGPFRRRVEFCGGEQRSATELRAMRRLAGVLFGARASWGAVVVPAGWLPRGAPFHPGPRDRWPRDRPRSRLAHAQRRSSPRRGLSASRAAGSRGPSCRSVRTRPSGGVYTGSWSQRARAVSGREGSESDEEPTIL